MDNEHKNCTIPTYNKIHKQDVIYTYDIIPNIRQILMHILSQFQALTTYMNKHMHSILPDKDI